MLILGGCRGEEVESVRRFLILAAYGLPSGTGRWHGRPGCRSIFDQINAVTKRLCGFSFTFTTIDMHYQGSRRPAYSRDHRQPPVHPGQGTTGLTRFPRAATSSEGPALILGTVIINGKPVTIAVQR